MISRSEAGATPLVKSPSDAQKGSRRNRLSFAKSNLFFDIKEEDVAVAVVGEPIVGVGDASEERRSGFFFKNVGGPIYGGGFGGFAYGSS